MIPELATALTSPEILPWLTGSGGALFVLAFWVNAERDDKKNIAKENRRLLDRVDERDDTVTSLVRECTSCISSITERVSLGQTTSEAVKESVHRLEQLVAQIPCAKYHVTPQHPASHDGPSSIPSGLPTGV